MAERGAPLKVLVKSPFSQYSGYGNDGFGIIRALQRWGCDVYPQPTWVDVPIPPDLLPLFGKTLRGPFDLLINHWDPEHLEITRSAREMSRVAVGWTMWEFSGGPGPRYDEKAQELKKAKPDMSDDEVRERGGIVVPGPVSGLLPLCGRVYDTETPEGDPQQDGLYSRLRWYDLVLGYDQVSLEAISHYLPPKTAGVVLQGGYEARDWSYIDRDWHGDRFQFLMHGALNNRKQPWLAIEAFQKLKYEKGDAFAGARLALHTNAPGTLFPELNEPFKPFGIKVFVDTWDMSTLRDFYAAGHCLLAPSKGEGKNLPALEFGTTGGAVIATNYSGHVQWIGGDWAYPLDYKLSPTFADHPWGAHSAEVDLNHLADTMWHVFTHRSEAEAKGRLASQLFPKMCDWSVVIEKFFEKIRDNVPKVGPQVYDAAMACRKPEQEPAGRILA